MADTDPVAAVLREMYDRAGLEAASTAAPLGTRSCDDATLLIGAIRAVLAEHRDDSLSGGWCSCCAFAWPCSTVRTITSALTGEEAGIGQG